MTTPTQGLREQVAPTPVAWRVKDFADGWILCHSESAARREAEGAGNLIEPLYRTPPLSPGAGVVEATYQVPNLQYRLDMAAAAFRAVLRSSDRAEVEAFAQAGLDYAAGDQEALAEGAAFTEAALRQAKDPTHD